METANPKFLKEVDKLRFLSSCYFFLFPFFFLFLCQSVFAQSTVGKEIDTLRVVTWNIQMLPRTFAPFSKSLRKMQRHRAPWIAEFLKDKNYDIVVFQEAFDKRIVRRMRRLLKDQYPYQVRAKKPFFSFKTTSGVWIISKLPIHESHQIRYRGGAYTYDKWAHKGCTFIQSEKNGVAFQLAGTHLQSGGSPKPCAVRERQMAQIYQKLLQPYQREGIPQLMLGDMNIQQDDPKEFSKLLETLHAQYYPFTDEERPFTSDYTDSWNTYKTKNDGHQIDYILLRPNGSPSYLAHQSILRPRHLYKDKLIDLSDHYGVLGTFILVRK